MTSPHSRLTAALSDRYRIERELGQGGMATVYLAEDVRHRRKVAIKVLHPELSSVLGPDRFLKEIELTANLQHPHILPLFDSGAAEGLLYYVMPFVEGESLRNRLAREKQLPIADAVRIASEVASALDYAHRRSVVHRDIKPENILLHDGQALVADFGIALAVAQAGGSRMTQTGLSLGTPQYMSPEQAMGEREISARSDIYALGCVTYEMLAGEPPFTGPTAQAIVARVLTESPRPLLPQRHTIPPHVEAAVLAALEKLPADRFASAAEFSAALARPGFVTPPATTEMAVPGGPHARSAVRALTSWSPWILAALALGVAGWSLLRPHPVRPRPVIRYSITPPADIRILDVGGQPLVVSPDGSRLVYVGASTGGRPRQLYLWPLDGAAPTLIPGTENASFPFFSADGEWVGFLSGAQLRRVRLGGGGVVTIGEITQSPGTFRGAAWTSKGEVIFATSTGLQRVLAEGGSPRPFAHAAQQSHVLVFPDALPGGESIVVGMNSRASTGPPELGVVSLASGAVTPLHQPGNNPRYVEPGYLAYTNSEGALLAVPFKPRSRKITGTPKPIVAGVSIGSAGIAKLGVSRSGTVAFLEGLATEQRQLLRLDRRGAVKVLDAPLRTYNGPRISPDGRRIAVTIGAVPNPPMDIWVYDVALRALSRISVDSTSSNVEWSADGRRVYHRRGGTSFRVMATPVDGSTPPESLYASAVDLWEALPTRSGDTLITRELRSIENDRDLMLVPLKSGSAVVPFAAGPRIQAEPAFSPDGRWLAYSSEESGTFEVYVRAFPGPGPRYQISPDGGTSPRWNPKGGELFFLSRDSLVVVPVTIRGGTLEHGRARALFANRYAPSTYHAPYDVSPDGTWFAFVGLGGSPVSSSFRVILNWFEQP